ncbi:hypothetical protein C0991_008885 [Blastosporella zonata]|nr:hypothetical protein C0991_008885 [Blastosporella zonata]
MVTSHTYKLVGDIDIFFTDSGPPPSSTDYTTLIVLHGSAFTGDGFEKLHNYSHKHNLRTVIWNRRDYPGSTQYTDAEIDDLNNGRKIFLDRLAIQVADFLKQYIEKESIPKISADRKAGGFAIMGWSMGSATAMPLFSEPSLLAPELYALLEQYVKDLVLDGMSGYPQATSIQLRPVAKILPISLLVLCFPPTKRLTIHGPTRTAKRPRSSTRILDSG